MAYRVVADHIRTLSFAIADGSRPGNEGREYVLRRVLRRAVRYGSEKLGMDHKKRSLHNNNHQVAATGFSRASWTASSTTLAAFIPSCAPPATRCVCVAPSGCAPHSLQIIEILDDEERSFRRTMTKGIEQFKKMAAASDNATLSGPDAFLLWDTFGFPVDLTQLMAEEAGLSVDMAGYERAMEEARQKARAAAKKGSAAEFKFEAEATAYLANAGVPYTDDLPKYGDADVQGRVCALLTAAGFVDSVQVRT